MRVAVIALGSLGLLAAAGSLIMIAWAHSGHAPDWLARDLDDDHPGRNLF